MADDAPLTHRTVLAWLVPSLLGVVAGLLGWIGVTVAEMGKDMAVFASTQAIHGLMINGLDKRVRVIELERKP